MREEFQTPDGEAQHDDENFSHVAVCEYQGAGKPPVLHKEPLIYEQVHMSKEGFGNCTVTGSCEAVCPKEISLSFNTVEEFGEKHSETEV